MFLLQPKCAEVNLLARSIVTAGTSGRLAEPVGCVGELTARLDLLPGRAAAAAAAAQVQARDAAVLGETVVP